jgi:hypothetical protein
MKKPTMTIMIQSDSAKTDKRIMTGIFKCKQSKELRAPECTGKGYGVGNDKKICSVCLTYAK